MRPGKALSHCIFHTSRTKCCHMYMHQLRGSATNLPVPGYRRNNVRKQWNKTKDKTMAHQMTSAMWYDALGAPAAAGYIARPTHPMPSSPRAPTGCWCPPPVWPTPRASTIAS